MNVNGFINNVVDVDKLTPAGTNVLMVIVVLMILNDVRLMSCLNAAPPK